MGDVGTLGTQGKGRGGTARGLRDLLSVSGCGGWERERVLETLGRPHKGPAFRFLEREATLGGHVVWWLLPRSSGSCPPESVSEH